MKKLKELEDQHKQNEDDLVAARAELKEQELIIVGFLLRALLMLII